MLVAALVFPSAAIAGGQGEGAVVPAPEVVIERGEKRHVELRRALVSNVELPEGQDERRRLSPNERDALSRELREAMQNAYEHRPRRGKPE